MFELPLNATEYLHTKMYAKCPPASVGLGLIIIKLDYLRINAYTK